MILQADPRSDVPDLTATPPSMDELWRREYPVMVRLARALVDSPDRAEEIVQDAFAHTLRRFDKLARPGAYSGPR